MTNVPAPNCSPEDGCALCGDVAIRARVTRLPDADGVALAEPLDGAAQGLAVALDLVEGVAVGDVVLVHQGFAIERVEAP